ncbi:cysteine-rich receptor-like protein kinase 44 isoform X2 [Humulus lupulus]|uniref:cysteine-rich receptor-like protein kinase 44 isoform X2 n=1 Tax=Humulus lupulus TaxID=3486 RepID=UPI002B404B9B|nr:cysteine-rich receptor-like protein kinase 44 isoform X2 [Humulus lupulus]
MATMASLFSPLLLCWIFIILFPTQATAEKCLDETGNYILNSTYHDNLKHIFSTLRSSQNDNNGYGFYNLSYGNASNQIYAIGQCRADVMPDSCQRCFNDSTHNLQKQCPNQKEAVEWLNECVLHYSNRSLLGVMDVLPLYCLLNPGNVSPDAMEGYFQALKRLFINLKSLAAAGGSLRKFAAANVTVPPGYNNIYALVQCRPDLSQMDCNHCLDEAFRNSLTCAAGKRGGHVFLGTSCIFWYEETLFYNYTAVQNFQLPLIPPSQPPTTASPPLSLSNTGTKSNTLARTIVIVVVSTFVFVGLFIFTCVRLRPWRRVNKFCPKEEIVSVESLQYSFETIKTATDNFSERNKLGQGGFGVVYKGRLSDGQDVAVKRLSLGPSAQGDLEFKNEVMLVSKLQHRNLVRLLGFCLEGNEKLLVYEFVQNSSLDHLIFDPRKRKNLNWDRREKIIKGIARGLLYLHEDCHLRIIHRDLKASNILLDEEMNPKISDFRTAKHFVVDQTHDNTSRIVGTYGYMTPEYVLHGQFSVKSDIFSFGVLLLETVGGQKINYFRQEENSTEGLLNYTWRNWREGKASNMVDPLMRVGPGSEIARYIHIGLLCVQGSIANRPTMNTIILMLNSNSVSLPVPSNPAFSIHSNIQSDFNSRMNHSKRDDELVNASVDEASITELSPR